MLSPVRLSSVCRLSSVTFVHPTQPVEIFGNVSTLLVPWPSVNIHEKFYGDRSRGTPPSGKLNAREVAKYSDFGLSKAISRKQCRIGGKLVLITNRKSYMSFRLIPKSVTLDDLERRNGRYFELFSRNYEVGWMGVGAGLYMYDVVVKAVHVRYLISWWVSCYRQHCAQRKTAGI